MTIVSLCICTLKQTAVASNIGSTDNTLGRKDIYVIRGQTKKVSENKIGKFLPEMLLKSEPQCIRLEHPRSSTRQKKDTDSLHSRGCVYGHLVMCMNENMFT